jgi:hypothetical protein
VLAAVFAAVFAAVTAAVDPAILSVSAMDALRGVTMEPVRGVMGRLPGALRVVLYVELALDAAKDPGLDGRA